MKMNKLLALLLVLCMVVSMVACAPKQNADETKPSTPVTQDDEEEEVDPYIAQSREVYQKVLGEFYEAYQAALAEKNESKRYALMAIAEAKMLGAGIFLPTTSKGGNYSMSRVAPYTNTPVLFGNDTYRFHDRIVTTNPIKAEHINEMKAAWAAKSYEGTYEAYVKGFLASKGYTTKDTHVAYFDADPETWDVLSTSNAADSEILVNTYDGLIEYDMENNIQPALAESWTVSEDGLTYTFKIRQGQVWVDNQGREVAAVKADDFVAGLQHMMDTAGGLEYLVCAGCANIKNADEYLAGEADFADVGISAPDDSTLVYTLTEPTSYFMTMLGYGVFAPMSRSYYTSMGGKFGDDFDAAAEDYKYGKSPETIAYCGPFRVTNFTSKNTIKFDQNAKYWNVNGNNLKEMTFIYTDGTDHQKMYNEFMTGAVDGLGLTQERTTIAKEKGTFQQFAYVSDTDATTYCGFFNVNRAAFANYDDATAGVSSKTQEQKDRYAAAILNKHFRLALAMSIDRGAYNAQSVGEELKYNALVNSYTPGTFVNLKEETTVSINGTDKTYAAGTQYGQIVQDQLTADGIKLTVWNGTSSTGFDGWYNAEEAAAQLAIAVEELKAAGVEITAENPIYVDVPVQTDSTVVTNRMNVVKQSVEAATNGLIKINLVEYTTRDTYLSATYWYTQGSEANFDLNDGSGWGPDFGDPSSYLGTMLPDGAGYMTKSLGIF